MLKPLVAIFGCVLSRSFFCLQRLWILDEIMPQWSILAVFLWSWCWICFVSINVKKSIVTCVYQLFLLFLTKFISLLRLVFTMPRCNYFSIQDWVRIHSGTGKWVLFTWQIEKCKHFTWIILGCNLVVTGLEKLENGQNWRIWYKTGQLEVLSVHDLLPHPATAGEIK